MSALTPIPVTRLTGLPGANKTTRLNLKVNERLNKASHRRKPVSSALNFLVSGFRRNDVFSLDQWLLKRLVHHTTLARNKVKKDFARYCALAAMEARV